MGTRALSKGQRSWGMTTHPHPAMRLKNEYSYTSAAPLGLEGLF